MKRGSADDVSIPSDLDDNQWAEIHQHDYEKYQEEQRKKKEDFIKKKAMVRQTLDAQIKEQRK